MTYVWESITSIFSVLSKSGEDGTGDVGVAGAVSKSGDSAIQIERFHKFAKQIICGKNRMCQCNRAMVIH